MASGFITAGYTWTDGEVVTATKLNLAATPTFNSGQTYPFASGTVAAPSITFNSDLDNGIYRIGADNWGASCAGSAVWSVSTTAFTFGYGSSVTVTSAGVQGRIGATTPATGAFTTATASSGFLYSGTTNAGYTVSDGTVTGIVFASGSSALAVGTQTNHNVLILANNSTVSTFSPTGFSIVGKFGCNGAGEVAKPTVTGSRGGNAALASLLTALASYGLVTDSSS